VSELRTLPPKMVQALVPFIASETAVGYSTGLPAVPVRWVSIRDPEGGFEPQALLCTDLEADPERIVRWYVMSWQMEVSFQEACRHLGFETQRDTPPSPMRSLWCEKSCGTRSRIFTGCPRIRTR
jgi:hypothetical protein